MANDLSQDDINRIIESFQNQTLDKADWTHQAHIIVSFWFNWQFEFTVAFDKMKTGIILYNESVGTVNSDSSGYHETLTRFWMILIHNFLVNRKYSCLSDAIYAFIKTSDSHKNSPLDYYTKALLFSLKARHHWINGDIKILRIKEVKR